MKYKKPGLKIGCTAAAIIFTSSVTLAGITLDRIDGILSSYSAGLEFANSEESQRAMVHFTRAAELYPYAPTAFVAKAKLMERLGRSHEAETELARAKEVQAHFGSGANIAFDTGTQMGEADQAVVHTLSQNVPLEKSSSTSSTTALSYHDTTRLIELYYQGLQSIFDGEYQKAIENFTEIHEVYPNCAAVWRERGRALVLQGERGQGLAALLKADQLSVNNKYAITHENHTQTDILKIDQSTQTDIAPIATSSVQTDSSTIGASEIATQTLPAKIFSTFTQTAALEHKNTGIQTNSVAIGSTEQKVQTEANVTNQDVQTDDIATNKNYSDSSTSTDDLFVLGAGVSHSDILDWEVASHSASESDESSYSESVSAGSIANARIDEEEEQVLSDVSQQILSEDNSDFYKTVAEIDEILASDISEGAVSHTLEDNNNNAFLQRQQELESEKTRLASASMELASHSTSNMTGSIISDIDKRLKDAFSLSVVSAGEEEQARASSIVGGHSGFYISPFIGKTIQQEIASRSGYHSKTRGAIIGYDMRVNDSILLGFNFTKANSKIKFRNNKLGDTASLSSNFYALYGLYTPVNQNIFISTIGIYGISDIKSSAKRPDSQIATSNHKAYSNIMQVMFGYNYKPISSLSIKPIFGIKYSKIRDASYQEYGAGAYNLALSGTKSLELETITGLELSNSSVHASSISITPEIHCFLHKNIKSKNPNITAKFLDEGVLLSSGPINRSKLSLSYGAGLNVAAKNLEIGLFYNGNKARKYMSHAGSIKLKINI